ncbi:S24 family peptidase [Winogradskyella psychrotolerans]|nr:S24 family peptidase [Winogradskyella psychrotolerans]
MKNSPNNKQLNENTTVYKLRTDKNYEEQSIPLYNIEATAGLVNLFQNNSDQRPIDTISIPNLPKCDGALYVTGDSMYPLLKSGDIVAYKKIQDFQNDVFWGEMYLVSVEVAGEEYVSVKYVQKSDKGDDYIKLVSQNQHHQPKDVKLKKVRAMALIKASIRINSMH